ncbi:hypothetical protein D8674_017662 [Pyrus ussuriensis x Pyrus communis]|uniref:Uncharacterized protein n=1 Tax=Pyrus ussuriensis x Pyrus communis TaxID=2448454 RepID=A0A5N5HIP9_9ROSA|nr:hypothetical protein D8674_017662 [Pyrus ussuriensis x Pyrus communis]
MSTERIHPIYASPDGFQNLIKQVLSWDIRCVSMNSQPHNSFIKSENGKELNQCPDDYHGKEDKIYHLILQGLDVSYRLDCEGSVVFRVLSW